jgi:hypothetical protein
VDLRLAIRVRLAAGFRLLLRVESEQQNDQNEEHRSYSHGFFGSSTNNCRLEEAEENADQRTREANQKEKSQAGSWAIEFVCMILSKGFQDRHFTICEILAQWNAYQVAYRG